MVLSDGEFHHQVEEITQAMLHVSSEYVGEDNRVETLYVYCGNDKNALQLYETFYKIDGRIVTLPDSDKALGRPEAGEEAWDEALDAGGDLLEKLVDLFADNGRDVPQEIRMVYDVKRESMDMDLSYEPFPDDKSPMSESTRWRKSIAGGQPPLPGH